MMMRFQQTLANCCNLNGAPQAKQHISWLPQHLADAFCGVMDSDMTAPLHLSASEIGTWTIRNSCQGSQVCDEVDSSQIVCTRQQGSIWYSRVVIYGL